MAPLSGPLGLDFVVGHQVVALQPAKDLARGGMVDRRIAIRRRSPRAQPFMPDVLKRRKILLKHLRTHRPAPAARPRERRAIGVGFALPVNRSQRHRGNAAEMRLDRGIERVARYGSDSAERPVNARRCRKRDMRAPSLTG
jgi:hypothetical protein